MLQRGTIPTVTAQAAELTEGWQESLQGEWSAALRAALRLPTTGRGFLLYCLALTFVASALSVHVLISVQVLDARLQVRRLEARIERVERVNSEIAYATSRTTSVEQMMQRAQSQGYTYTTEREYVALAAVAIQPEGAQTQSASSQLSSGASDALADGMQTAAIMSSQTDTTLGLENLTNPLSARSTIQATYRQALETIGGWPNALRQRINEGVGRLETGRLEFVRAPFQLLGERSR